MNTVLFRAGLKVRYCGPAIADVKEGQILTVKTLAASYAKRSDMWFTFVSFEETTQELSLNVLRPAKGKQP